LVNKNLVNNKTTAGMLEGGPVLYYIKELGDDPKNK
jgi:predicted metal-dependent RNase